MNPAAKPGQATSRKAETRRAAFKRDALQAWEHYQATGLHVTHEEMDAWLRELEQGREIAPPAVHT